MSKRGAEQPLESAPAPKHAQAATRLDVGADEDHDWQYDQVLRQELGSIFGIDGKTLDGFAKIVSGYLTGPALIAPDRPAPEGKKPYTREILSYTRAILSYPRGGCCTVEFEFEGHPNQVVVFNAVQVGEIRGTRRIALLRTNGRYCTAHMDRRIGDRLPPGYYNMYTTVFNIRGPRGDYSALDNFFELLTTELPAVADDIVAVPDGDLGHGPRSFPVQSEDPAVTQVSIGYHGEIYLSTQAVFVFNPAEARRISDQPFALTSKKWLPRWMGKPFDSFLSSMTVDPAKGTLSFHPQTGSQWKRRQGRLELSPLPDARTVVVSLTPDAMKKLIRVLEWLAVYLKV
jgi:hypothetical protein